MRRALREKDGFDGLMSLSLDRELSIPPSLWLLVEVARCGGGLHTTVLRAEHVLVVGRDAGAGLVLAGALVSRRHVLVRATATGLEVEDLSTHGTLVDGAPLHKARVQVPNVSELMIGHNRVRMRRLS